jgi:hypothetical protein
MKTLFFVLAPLLFCGCSGAAGTFPSTDTDAATVFVKDYTGCTNDTDCDDNGTACGTDVCSWANANAHVCVPSSTNDLGWCGDPLLDQTLANETCKCFAQGATCNITTNFCSFTK